jgi:hypothetical protein
LFKKPQIVKENKCGFSCPSKLRGNYSETLSGSGRGIKIFPFLGKVGVTAHLTTGGQHLAPAQTQYSSTGEEN